MHTTRSRDSYDNVLSGLDREWAIVQHSSAARRALRRWSPALAAAGVDVDPVMGLEALIAVLWRPGDPYRSDAVMRVLLREFHDGDELAGRVLVQALVGFVGSLAARYVRGSSRAAADDIVAEILAAVQLRIVRLVPRPDQRMLLAHLQLTVRRQMRRRAAQLAIGNHREHPARLDLIGNPGDPDDDGPGAWTGVERELTGPNAFAQLVSRPERDSAGHVATIVRRGTICGAISPADAELLLLVAAGHAAASIARTLDRDPSVIIRRLHRATAAAGRIAA
jgi:hypothetical protein